MHCLFVCFFRHLCRILQIASPSISGCLPLNEKSLFPLLTFFGLHSMVRIFQEFLVPSLNSYNLIPLCIVCLFFQTPSQNFMNFVAGCFPRNAKYLFPFTFFGWWEIFQDFLDPCFNSYTFTKWFVQLFLAAEKQSLHGRTRIEFDIFDRLSCKVSSMITPWLLFIVSVHSTTLNW